MFEDGGDIVGIGVDALGVVLGAGEVGAGESPS